MTKKYQVIYADPPWVYKDKSKSHGGGAESHYVCTPTSEMCKWDIPAEKDAVLLMWCTYPMLEEGLKLMAAWGFKFKTVAFTWVKKNKDGSVYMGMGRHTRGNAEICLLGTRGKGVPREHCGIYNTQLHGRGRHSEKPDSFRKDIVRLYGLDKTRLEMFARKQSEGWDVWGNEVECAAELPSAVSQKRAQARYDAKRPTGMLVRFEEAELRELDSQRKEGESRPAAVKRLLGFAP